MLQPGYAKTFSDYASQVFLPYIVSQAQHGSQVDHVALFGMFHAFKGCDTESLFGGRGKRTA